MTNKNKSKRYYWIKLKDSFFTSDTVDFLMSQKNGANYIVLYQMLCLKTINTNGVLSKQLGELLVPFDIDKIQRDCKYFDRDTIVVALELFKKIGLIYEVENNILVIANYDNLVGSETQGAIEQRKTRQIKKDIQKIDKGIDNVYQDIDIRDKSIDIENKDIDNKTINNNIRENEREKLKSIFINFCTENNIPDEIKKSILLWLKYKKEKKQKYTETGLKVLLKKLLKDYLDNGEDYVVNAINNSISQNYNGIYTDTKTKTKKVDAFDEILNASIKGE